MTSDHERTETLTFVAIALAVAGALSAMSVTSDRARETKDDTIGVATPTEPE